MKTLLLTCVFLVLASLKSFAQQPPANIQNGLDAVFMEYVNQAPFVPGHVIRVEKPGAWVYEKAAGVAVRNTNVPTQPNMKFKIASVTKIFTSVAIFKLARAGQLNLNDTIGKFLPYSVTKNFSERNKIRVRDLLSHKSGIIEPQSDFQGRMNFWVYMKPFEDIPLDSLLLWSYPPSLGYGRYNYSNANFYVLAEIIKSITSKSYQQFVTDSIILPLQLTNTDFNRIPTGSFMRGYTTGTFYPLMVQDSIYDFTEASNTWGYGAADLWSNNQDLISFHKALFTGQLIGNQWLDTMKTITTDMSDMGAYCYGIERYKSFNNGPFYGYGHTGSAFGYGSMLNYIPEMDIYISSAGNFQKISQAFMQRNLFNFLNQLPAHINNDDEKNQVFMYPNPVTDNLYINNLGHGAVVSVYNATGQIVYNKPYVSSMALGHLPSGVYFIQVVDEGKRLLLNKKIVKI